MSATTQSQTLRHPKGDATVEFHWSHDRFEHRIRIEGTTLRSHPGLAQDTWPASPPLQQLSIEEIGEHDIAFGVGSAGTSHWSVSVEPSADGFRFDWACRTKEPPGFLGTTYERDERFVLHAGEQSTLALNESEVILKPADAAADSAGTLRWSYEVKASKSP